MRMLALAALLTLAGPAQVPEAEATAHAALLARRVVAGRVDYRGLAEHDLAALDAYLAKVAAAPLPANRDAAVAFLADAYNALVVRSVIRHGRPRSVLDVKGFFDRDTHRVAGREVTLDQLEKRWLLPLAKDPRLHFVLVCAAVGCPVLDPRPLTGAPLEARLDEATRRYLASPAGLRAAPGEVQVSRLFDWYAADFGGAEGVRVFVRRHAPASAAAALEPPAKLGFLDYNWTLNQR
jgi:hypothetical protein